MPATLTMFGIRNCDTVKKARAWLEARDIAYTFHDYKTEGVTIERLDDWCRRHGWETICNRSGQTFRKLPEESRQGLDAAKAVTLMAQQPSMIKRPIVEGGRRTLIGFDPAEYEAALG